MMTLDHYGLHWLEGDIGLLVQDIGVDHVLGIPMDFPVEVKKQRTRMVCPHTIRLDEAEYHELPDDELVRAMLPVPKSQDSPILFVENTDDNTRYVRELLRLSSSGSGCAMPLWMADGKAAGPLMNLTNLSPMVVFGYSMYDQIKLNRLIQMANYSFRQLLLIGPKGMVLRSEVKRISVTPTDLSDIPLERVGTWYLKQRMLGHELYFPRKTETMQEA